MTYTNFVYVQVICDFIRNVIGEKTDVIASGFSGSFAVMACRNENALFNKLVLVNSSCTWKSYSDAGKEGSSA